MEVKTVTAPPEPAAPEPGEATEGQSLRDLLQTVWRHKLLFFLVIFTGMFAAAVMLDRLTPRFTSTSKILIEPQDNNVVDIESVVAGLATDSESIQSEIEVIRSNIIAEKVIKRLKLLDNDAAFEGRADDSPALRKMYRALRAELRALARPDGPAPGQQSFPTVSPTDPETKRMIIAVKRLLDSVTVRGVGRSRVLAISYEAEDPHFAAAAANAFAEAYVDHTLEVKFEGTRRATEWLERQLEELREQVELSDRAVEIRRSETGLIKGKTGIWAAEQITALNSQLISARIVLAEAEARLRNAQRLLKAPDKVDSIGKVMGSSLIQSLRRQESEILRKLAELSTEYGAKHPRIIQVTAELEDLRQKIQTESARIVDSLRNEVTVARAKVNAITTSLDDMKDEMARLNEAETEVRSLEREFKATQDLYQMVLARKKQARGQNELQEPDARVIVRAQVPQVPSFPRKKEMFAAAALACLMLGFVAIFLVEYFDFTLRSPAQVRRHTGLATIGVVPSTGRSKGGPLSLAKTVVDDPGSDIAEAIGTLNANVSISRAFDRPKVVTITSAAAREGKTALAIAMATSSELAGRRTLLIDANLRSPDISSQLDFSDHPGLSEYLRGESELSEIIQGEGRPGFDIIAAGRNSMNIPELLQGEPAKSLLSRVRERYDLVIVDSPAILTYADARMLAAWSDTTVLAVRWEKTHRQEVVSAASQLRGLGADVAGVAFTQVDLKKMAKYSAVYPAQRKSWFGWPAPSRL